MAFKYSKSTLGKLETLVKHLGYYLRYERGSFKPGYCVLQEKKVVVVNKFYSLESRINSLLELIPELNQGTQKLDEKEKVLLESVMTQKSAS